MKAPFLSLTAAVGVLVFASGCTFPSSRRTVPAAQANVLQRSELGVVTSVRDVNIEGSKGQLGLYGGGVVVVMVIATAAGSVPLAVGVAAHEGSTLVVCLNSLRLLFGRNR